jgi:DNA repair protein RadC
MEKTARQDVKYDPNNEKTWAVNDLPQEKLQHMGMDTLSDTDLLACLLTGASNPVTTARTLYSEAKNDLNNLATFSMVDLQKIEGIGFGKATLIRCAFELGKRKQLTPQTPKMSIKSSETVSNLMQPLLGDLQHEEFWLLTLNRANKIIDKYKISQGGLSGTVIDTRIILKKALDDLASSIIVVHNHPSGNNQPSDADIKITEKLNKAAKHLEIKLLDHIIVGQKDSYFSFADDGLIF